MKNNEIVKLLWNILSLTAAVGTYYGTWEHNWIIILVCVMPQLISLGYGVAKS